MSRVQLQLTDPSAQFEYEGVTLSGKEVGEFPDTNQTVQRAIAGRIVRVVRPEELAPAVAAAPAAPAPEPAPAPVPKPATAARAKGTAAS